MVVLATGSAKEQQCCLRARRFEHDHGHWGKTPSDGVSDEMLVDVCSRVAQSFGSHQLVGDVVLLRVASTAARRYLGAQVSSWLLGIRCWRASCGGILLSYMLLAIPLSSIPGLPAGVSAGLY